MPKLSPTQVVTHNVRAEMARTRNTQVKLAASIGMTQQSLSRRLAGRTSFTIDELSRIATVLDVTLADLILPDTTTPTRRIAV